jgi:hypothetical protein
LEKESGDPYGVRTRVARMKTWSPRPLDEGVFGKNERVPYQTRPYWQPQIMHFFKTIQTAAELSIFPKIYRLNFSGFSTLPLYFPPVDWQFLTSITRGAFSFLELR